MTYGMIQARRTVALCRWGMALSLTILMTLPFARPAVAASDDRYKVVSGVAVYLGLLPAEMIKGHPRGHTESTMHRGERGRGPHEYHLVAAVFDEKAGTRIENASVLARVSGLGLAGENIALEPMSIANTITYGGFVNLPDDIYTIKITVRRPGDAEPIAVDFKFDHRLSSRR